MCIFAYMCIFICISLENSTKKPNPMLVCKEQNWGRRKGRLFNVYFILFEFWTMWMYYSFTELKDRKRGGRRRLFWERLARGLFGEVVPWPEPSGTEGLLCSAGVPGLQHSWNRLSQPQAVCGSEAVSLAKGRVTRSQECFLFFLLILRWVELLPCHHGYLAGKSALPEMTLPSPKTFSKAIWAMFGKMLSQNGKMLMVSENKS